MYIHTDWFAGLANQSEVVQWFVIVSLTNES